MPDKISQQAKGENITQVAGDVNIITTIDIDGEIEDAANFIEEGKCSEAINLLERLWRRHNDKMTARQKYRTQANIGHAYNQMEKFDDAARYWLTAYQYEPNYKEAQARQALAYLYLGNMPKARDIVKEILKKYPENIYANAIWIRTSPDEMTIDDVEKQIPKHQKDDADILMALASFATDIKDYNRAEKYITKALEVSNEHPKIKEQLGRLLLQKAELWKYTLLDKKPTSEEISSIKKAIEYISDACDKWKEQNNNKQLSQAKLALASAYRAIGNNDEIENNIRLSYELDNSNEQAVCEYAALLANAGEINDAIDLLAPLIDKPKRLAIIDFYAQLLINRNGQNDKNNALELLKERITDIKNTISAFRFDYINQVALLISEIESESEAIDYIVKLPSDLLSNFSCNIIKAGIYSLGENRKKAIGVALELCQKDCEKQEWYEKRNLAILLQSLRQWEHALNIWQEITPANYLSRDTGNLLESARRADDAKAILDFCEQLRNNQIWDDKTINFELDYREQYNDNEKAAEIMQAYLQYCNNEDNAAIMRLRLSYLGLRTHRPELLEKDRNKLPEVTEVTPNNGKLIVQVLRFSPDPLQALDYAYELWRLHPDDEDANLAYISSLLPLGPKVKLPEYDTVQDGVAVLYEDETTKERTWHIIEDSPFGNIANSYDEYSVDHYVSKAIMGKKQGDSFYLVKNELQERKATVFEISSKYLHRYRKCFKEFPRKFPDSKQLESIPGFNLDGTVNLEPIKRLAQRDEKGIKEIMAMYEQNIIPIYMLAKLKQVSEFVVMNYYGYCSELKIKTCFGTVDEWDHAVMAANNAERFVLDMTSLVTLLLLDDDFWTSLPDKLVISEETYNRLNNIEAARKDYTNEGGYVSCENEKLSFTPKNVSQVKVEQERVKHFIEQVNKHCDIVSGISLAEIPTDKRNLLTGNIGQANAETIVLASRSGSVLWTDDLALACIANSEFGCRRIWSQVVINTLNKNIVPELNLQLYKYGYTFTKIGLEEFKQALTKSKWQVNKSPLEELMSIFSDSNISTESITSLFASFIKYIWQNTTEFAAQQITLYALNELSKRQLGFFIVKAIHIDALFGLDIINANKAMSVIRNWLRISVVGLH